MGYDDKYEWSFGAPEDDWSVWVPYIDWWGLGLAIDIPQKRTRILTNRQAGNFKNSKKK